MSTKLKANFVFAGIEDEIITVGFADDEFETNEYILLQKALVCSDQDKLLGHNKVNIIYLDQLKSAYGGIIKIELKNNSITISLDNTTAKKITTEQTIDINISHINSINLQSVIEHLTTMFKDEPNILCLKQNHS